MDDRHGPVQDFLQQRPDLADPTAADNQCAIATLQLVDFLRDRGVTATRAWVRGHRQSLENPAPRAKAATRHCIVRLPSGTLVDITRRQFDPDAQHPSYYASEEELASHWREIDRGPPEGAAAEEDWQPLEPPASFSSTAER